jgi:hypothetical protein
MPRAHCMPLPLSQNFTAVFGGMSLHSCTMICRIAHRSLPYSCTVFYSNLHHSLIEALSVPNLSLFLRIVSVWFNLKFSALGSGRMV